jgi:hypothetical protein
VRRRGPKLIPLEDLDDPFWEVQRGSWSSKGRFYKDANAWIWNVEQAVELGHYPPGTTAEDWKKVIHRAERRNRRDANKGWPYRAARAIWWKITGTPEWVDRSPDQRPASKT